MLMMEKVHAVMEMEVVIDINQSEVLDLEIESVVLTTVDGDEIHASVYETHLHNATLYTENEEDEVLLSNETVRFNFKNCDADDVEIWKLISIEGEKYHIINFNGVYLLSCVNKGVVLDTGESITSKLFLKDYLDSTYQNYKSFK